MDDLYNKKEVAIKLIHTSCYDPIKRGEIEDWVNNCNDSNALGLAIKKLQDNQLDLIAYGFNYTSKDIVDHIKKIM